MVPGMKASLGRNHAAEAAALLVWHMEGWVTNQPEASPTALLAVMRLLHLAHSTVFETPLTPEARAAITARSIPSRPGLITLADFGREYEGLSALFDSHFAAGSVQLAAINDGDAPLLLGVEPADVTSAGENPHPSQVPEHEPGETIDNMRVGGGPLVHTILGSGLNRRMEAEQVVIVAPCAMAADGSLGAMFKATVAVAYRSGAKRRRCSTVIVPNAIYPLYHWCPSLSQLAEGSRERIEAMRGDINVFGTCFGGEAATVRLGFP